jgi:hypothetical protein
MKTFVAIILLIGIQHSQSKAQTGCLALSGNGAGVANEQLTSTTGNAQLDFALTKEIALLRVAFDANCSVWILNDQNGMNAYATQQVLNPACGDGSIKLGYRMMLMQLQLSNWGATLPFILAHEFGHIKAYKNGWSFSRGEPTVKKDELFADFCAGCYMWDRQAFAATDVKTTIIAFLNLGDFGFFSHDHHGTPQERVNALMNGFEFTHQFRVNHAGEPLSDNALRSGFLSFLNQSDGSGSNTRETSSTKDEEGTTAQENPSTQLGVLKSNYSFCEGLQLIASAAPFHFSNIISGVKGRQGESTIKWRAPFEVAHTERVDVTASLRKGKTPNMCLVNLVEKSPRSEARTRYESACEKLRECFPTISFKEDDSDPKDISFEGEDEKEGFTIDVRLTDEDYLEGANRYSCWIAIEEAF